MGSYSPSGQTLSPTIGAGFPATYNTFPGSTTYVFTLPALNAWSTTTGKYQLNIQTTAAFATNTAINVGVNDGPGFIQNGQLSYPAYGLDPNTKADLGQPMLVYGGTSEQTGNGISGAVSGPIALCFKAGC